MSGSPSDRSVSSSQASAGRSVLARYVRRYAFKGVAWAIRCAAILGFILALELASRLDPSGAIWAVTAAIAAAYTVGGKLVDAVRAIPRPVNINHITCKEAIAEPGSTLSLTSDLRDQIIATIREEAARSDSEDTQQAKPATPSPPGAK